MKNNIFKVVLGSIMSLVTVSSCQKLERDYSGELTKAQIESSASRTASMLNTVYSELQEGFTHIGEANMASATDEAEFNKEGNNVQRFNTGNWGPSFNPNDVWGDYYRGIRKANYYLELDKSRVDLNAFRASVTAFRKAKSDLGRSEFEARFLRAFFYFELVKRYGGVPLLKTTIDESSIATVKRNTVEECFKFIVDECDAVINGTFPGLNDDTPIGLPLRNAFSGSNASDMGRVTRGAAMALKSRALLYAASDLFNMPDQWASGYANKALISFQDVSSTARTLRWQQAADASKALIDAYEADGVNNSTATQLPAYATLFGTNGQRQDENIFFRRNSTNTVYERANYPGGFQNAGGGTNPTQNLVEAYEVRVGAAGVTQTATNFDFTSTTHVANMYNSGQGANQRDPRLALTIVFNRGSQLSGTSGFSGIIETFEGGAHTFPRTNNGTKTGYYVRKYINGTPNNNSAHTWVYFRLAEIYLNYAEAMSQLGNQAVAKTYIDKVRSRQGVTMPLTPVGLSQAQTLQKIMQERRVEFAFEDHRYWDARRWLLGPQILGAQVDGLTITSTNAPTNTTFTYAKFKVEDRVFNASSMYLFPIPQTELAVTKGVLAQNPGW